MISFSVCCRMVRPGCPVILLHLFSIFVQTGGMTHMKVDGTRWNHPPHQFLHLLVFRSKFNELFCNILLLASTQDIMYPYGPGHRDLETPKMDDGSSPEITVLIHFIFFNVPYRSIYVSLDQSSQPLIILHQAAIHQSIKIYCNV